MRSIKLFALALLCFEIILTSAVILEEKENFGCPDDNFATYISRGYIPLLIQTTYLPGNTTELDAEFGEGVNYSINRSPIHFYILPGNYAVDFTTINLEGTDSKLAIKDFIGKHDRVSPKADFNSNITSGYVPLSVEFTDLSTNASSWKWNFGDGTSSREQDPLHTYRSPGNYSVKLTVTNKHGIDSKTLKIFAYKATSINKILPVANFTSSETSGYAPLFIKYVDTSQYATEWNWDFDNNGITESTETSPIYTYIVPGTYVVNLTVGNANGTDSKTSAIIVMESSSSGGSGSSGSANGSPEPQSNVAAKELSQTFISSGKSVKFYFLRNVTPVVYVGFDSKKTAGKTTTIAEVLKGKSTLVTGLPSDEVYKHLNVWVGNSGFAISKNIENAVVSFKVEKTWIQDKKIDKSSVTLNRYNDKKWNPLPTSMSDEDDNYLHFTAKTPGFSPFAITGKTIATGNSKQTAYETNTQHVTMNEKVVHNDTGLNDLQKQKKNENLLEFGMFCIISIVLAALFFKLD